MASSSLIGEEDVKMIRRFAEYYPHSEITVRGLSLESFSKAAQGSNLRIGFHGVAGVDPAFIKPAGSFRRFSRLYSLPSGFETK
jgi:hypothetical protein